MLQKNSLILSLLLIVICFGPAAHSKYEGLQGEMHKKVWANFVNLALQGGQPKIWFTLRGVPSNLFRVPVSNLDDSVRFLNGLTFLRFAVFIDEVRYHSTDGKTLTATRYEWNKMLSKVVDELGCRDALNKGPITLELVADETFTPSRLKRTSTDLSPMNFNAFIGTWKFWSNAPLESLSANHKMSFDLLYVLAAWRAQSDWKQMGLHVDYHPEDSLAYIHDVVEHYFPKESFGLETHMKTCSDTHFGLNPFVKVYGVGSRSQAFIGAEVGPTWLK